MSNFSIGGRGGNPIPSTTLVATDQETIFGDGSGQNPLTTNGANSGQFIPINFTLQIIVAGNPVAFNGADAIHVLAGGNEAPINAPVGIAVPNPAGGLRVQTGGLAELPIADWDAVIAGGSSTGLTPGCWYYLDSILGQITLGVPNPLGATISTSSSPVGARVGYAISTTEMLVLPGGSPNTLNLANGGGVTLGMPVVANGSGQAIPAQANSAAGSAVLGVAAYINTDNSVIVLTDGMDLELVAAHWNALTGGGAGLTEGAAYYLSAATGGDLVTPTPTATAGDFAVLIGVALSTTRMAIRLGAPGYAHP